MKKKMPQMPDLPPDFPAFIALPSDNESQAVVRVVEGQLVLDDPAALGVMAAVEAHNRGIAKENCLATLRMNADRVAHFKGRMDVLKKSPKEVVIVLINVDDVHGKDMADSLMPGNEAMWQSFRDQGQVPFARGLAEREGIQNCLNLIDSEAAGKLRDSTGTAVVVVDHGTADVYGV
jgi:hypothetical protein